MNDATHVFLVDDDAELRQMTAAYLRRNGLEVTALDSGDAALARLARVRPHCLVLDLMMPGTDGLAVCRELRRQADPLPIVMLTARADDVDRIVGLELGADDYLGKPFNPRELLARIHAVLRRRAAPPDAPVAAAARVTIGEVLFDPAARTLTRGDAVTMLSSAEFALLRALVERPRQPLSRERLVELAKGPGSAVKLGSVDTAIFRLRRLIESDPSAPRFLQTMRTVGYVFVPGEDA
jgi:two-component system, OmpR family, phosphate regulon response regulator OmpR